MVIAKGESPNILIKLFSGKEHGTFFVPKREKLTSRKCWIGFTLKPKGALQLDEGAAIALFTRGKSLLPSGIIGVAGDFDVGAPVEFKKRNHEIMGIGLVN